MVAAEIEAVLRTYFQKDADDCVAVYLFGSVARGTDRPTSDVDVGVLYRRAPKRRFPMEFLRQQADLEALLHRRVDVVVMNNAPVDLVHRIMRDGRIVLDVDRSARLAFEVKARNEYFDLKYYLDLYRDAAKLAPKAP